MGFFLFTNLVLNATKPYTNTLVVIKKNEKMRKLCLLLIICLSSLNGNCQISMSKKIEVKKEVQKPKPYLAESNLIRSIIYDDVDDKSYYGLECFFAPLEVLKSKGCPIYIKKPNNESFDLDSIVNKTFIFKSILNPEDIENIRKRNLCNIKNESAGSYQREVFIELQLSTDENLIIYVGQYFATQNLILKPFFHKLQSKYLNKNMVAVNRNNSETTIIETEEKTIIPNQSIWKVNEISFDFINKNEYIKGYELVLKLKNEKFGTINYILDISKEKILNSRWNKVKFITEDDYLLKVKKEKRYLAKIEEEKNIRLRAKRKREKENIIKYGPRIGKLINNFKLEVGMSKEMCFASWGEPLIKKTIKKEGLTKEIFTYSRNHKVILVNNKITQIEY